MPEQYKVVVENDLTCAADLLKFLLSLQEQNVDLENVYVLNAECVDFDRAKLVEQMLTDGSTVLDIRLI